MNPKLFSIIVVCLMLCFAGSALADISATVTFSSGNFSVDTILGANSRYYSIVKSNLPNAVIDDSVGTPQLPIFSYVYSLPQGTQASYISVTSTTWQSMGTFSDTVYPIQTPMITHDGETQPAFVPPGVCYAQTYYPSNTVVGECAAPLNYSFGMGMATIRIWPVRYNITSSSLSLATSVTFTIHTTSASRSPFLAYERSTMAQDYIKNYLKGMVNNPNDVDGNLPTPLLRNYNYPTPPDSIPPDFIIVTDTIFKAELEAVRTWHEVVLGLKSKVYTMQYIVNNFVGYDNAEKLRNFIKDRYYHHAQFVFLAGSKDYVPIRYVTISDRSTPPGLSAYFPCDLYYADVDGDWDADGDHIYGEPTQDHPDIGADIWVGRIAISHPGDATTWLDKLDRYLTDGYQNYLSNVVISSSDQMQDCHEAYTVGHEFSNFFSVDSTTYIEKTGGVPDPGGLNPDWPQGQDITGHLAAPSVGCYISLSHGSPDYFATLTGGYNSFNLSGITSSYQLYSGLAPSQRWGYTGTIQNNGREYVHFSVACYLAEMDCHEIGFRRDTCYAEKDLLLDGGCVAGTFYTRYGDCYYSFYLEQYKIRHICDYASTQGKIPPSLNFAKIELFSTLGAGLIYGNNYFGDPSMPMWTSTHNPLRIDRPFSIYRGLEQTITVRVRDSLTSTAIPNILVTLSKGNEVYGRGLTDATGRVYLTVKANTAGILNVTASKPGFVAKQDTIIVNTYCDTAVAGDANGSGYCQGNDVIFLQRYLAGTGPHPPDSCMCTDSSTFLYHAADANGSCLVQGSDVTFLVAYFKGGAAPHICSTCPSAKNNILIEHLIPSVTLKRSIE